MKSICKYFLDCYNGFRLYTSISIGNTSLQAIIVINSTYRQCVVIIFCDISEWLTCMYLNTFIDKNRNFPLLGDIKNKSKN